MLNILVAFFLWFATFTPSERVALGSAFLVLVGVVGEYVADIQTIEARNHLHKRIKRFSMAVLVLGLSGDVLGIVMGQAEMAALTKEAGDAATSAKTAHDEADVVGKKTDAIQKRLESAAGHLSEVENDLLAQGPRWRLFNRGKDIFVETLKPFPGQQVTIVVCGNDDIERSGLEQSIFNAFREAKWDSPGYVRWSQCPNMLSGGIDIYFVADIDDSAEWATLPAQQWVKVECGRFNISHDASNTLCDVLNKLGIFTTAWREKPLPLGVGAERARAFFGFGTPDGPAEMAYKDPGRIFLLIGPNAPMFTSKNKNVKHK